MCAEKPRGRPLPLATTVLPRENSSQGVEAHAARHFPHKHGYLGSHANIHIKSCVRGCGLTVLCPRELEAASWSSLTIQPCQQVLGPRKGTLYFVSKHKLHGFLGMTLEGDLWPPHVCAYKCPLRHNLTSSSFSPSSNFPKWKERCCLGVSFMAVQKRCRDPYIPHTVLRQKSLGRSVNVHSRNFFNDGSPQILVLKPLR